ncbi:MAG TPA: ABC transporter substrate-binding protein [Paralcaligenes sp.]
MNNWSSVNRLRRRSALKGALALAGGSLLSGSPFTALAASSKQAVGNYPAGVKGDSAFVGIVVPLTGPYSSEGNDERRGYELAIEQLNSGAEEIRKISPLTKKGVLGKTIKFGVADGETKPNSAIAAATRFVNENRAIMVTGAVSSSVSVALGHFLSREKTLFIANFGSSNDVTGKDCQRYAFRLLCSAYAIAKAVAPAAAERLGHSRKAVYLVPDYTYGHTLYESTRKFTEEEGWETVGVQFHPLGATDYSSYLINIANSGADTFVNCDYGGDATNSVKQAKQFGVLGKMKMVVPQLSPFLADAVGADVMQEVIGVLVYWWTLQEQYPQSRDFVSAFRKKYNDVPRGTAALAYLNMALWADAIERAGTFNPPDVIKAYEKQHKRDGLVGDVWFRAADHQGVFNFPVLQGKKPGNMKDPKDFYNILHTVSGQSVVQPRDLFGCRLGAYS